ncbi:histidine phosphatase family protein [Henriciella sp.]|uniref:histidine phosphatase family protein n=1 Tax=Henriciella sp. TaxID=1968823 RepID=UPI0025C45D52|nr:histidine phosphatase family protein [Henriciella sp.]
MRNLSHPLYLVRHGETEWNGVGRYQGLRDSPLTRRGRDQAAEIGRALSKQVSTSNGPLRAYVSPLGRAQATADIIEKSLHLDRTDDVRLREISTGCWDGMSLYEIDIEYPGALDGSDRGDWYFRSPDGESLEAALARVRAWLQDVQTPALAVTHGLTSRLIRGVWLGLGDAEMLDLPVPQNGFFRLLEGRADFIPCGQTKS